MGDGYLKPVGVQRLDNDKEGIEQRYEQGFAGTKLPQNVFGSVSTGELAGTDTEASTVYSFPNGLEGVTVENFCPSVWNTAEADGLFVYVAFNNHAMSDATLAGLRYVVGPNSGKTFTFNSDTKPTQMTLRIDATQCTAHYTAAEVV